MLRRLLDRLLDLKTARQPVALVTDLSSGQQTLVQPQTQEGEAALPDDVLSLVRQYLEEGRSGILEENWFTETHLPPDRLILIGAVHIAQAIIPMAQMLGYGVSVIDPRGAFATVERFADVELLSDWPDDAMRQLDPDRRTAVVALTHDPKLDDPALTVALASPAFYVGALGSRKTHAGRLERLAAQGISAEKLARIHGPVGLPIGAKSQAEIAVSILAQITAVKRGITA